ncbi:hypothetical protein [Marinilactibacillus kalidii]|uniref:hypothetical protein n=1 Tax=Marinilactibacillus kalidii TaxID=2820274 RepID=UPI001ABDE4DA|nr:hypothetical protein [Marinilactibacillus kalidii]
MEERSLDLDKLIEEQDGFTFNMDEPPLFFFSKEGMTILNAENINKLEGDYPFPFLPDHMYEDYEFKHSDDLLQIEADGMTYDLTILGPRRFLDEENNIELSTNDYLLEDIEESE